MNNSGFSETSSSLLYSSIVSKRANQKKQTDAITASSTNKTFEIDNKQEHSNKSMKSGVYFNNHEIFNARHPTQVQYNVRHVTKVLNLPFGMPLAKPPRLSVMKHKFPSLSEPTTEESLPRKIDESQSEKEQEPPCARKRAREEKGSEEEGKLEEGSLKRSRFDTIVTSISSKKLSTSEERLFLEATIALSDLKSVPTRKKKTPSQKSKQKNSPKPSMGKIMPPPPPSLSFFKGKFSRVLLSLGQHS